VTNPEAVNAPQVKSTDQGEYWSSGLRVFEMMRIWLERMTEFYCYSPGENIGNKETFWVHPHPGWFNADFVRSSMIGSKHLTLSPPSSPLLIKGEKSVC